VPPHVEAELRLRLPLLPAAGPRWNSAPVPALTSVTVTEGAAGQRLRRAAAGGEPEAEQEGRAAGSYPCASLVSRTDVATSSRSTPMSMSERRLTYRQDFPVLCLPSPARSAG
jgi:hypothetical protein